MLTYIESNFVLEVVLDQEEANAANAILSLAESGKITLAVPVFALFEPSWTLSHREKERITLYRSLEQQFSQLRRSGLHQNLAIVLKDVISEMREIENKEMSAFDANLKRIFLAGNILATDKAILNRPSSIKSVISFLYKMELFWVR